MSTKTTFKRIALVAVAALGLGVLSVAPSSATVSAVAFSGATNGTSTNSSEGFVSDSTTAASVTVAGLLDSVQDTLTVSFVQKSGSTTPNAFMYFQDSATSGLTLVDTLTSVTAVYAAGTKALPYLSASDTSTGVSSAAGQQFRLVRAAAGYVGAKFAIQLDSTSSRAAGTYTYTVIVKGYSGSAAVQTFTQDLSIVVPTAASASTTVDPTTSSAVLNAGATFGGGTVDSSVSTLSTVSGTAKAVIRVINKNTAGGAVAESITATVTGPGLVRLAGDTSAGKSIKVIGDGNDDIEIVSDGSAGVASIVVATTSITYAAKSVTFFAVSASTFTLSANKPVIGVSSNTDVVRATILDANSNSWGGQAYIVAATAADALIAGSSTPVACTYDATNKRHGCPITGTAKGTANFTVIDAATVATAVGKSAATQAIRVSTGTATTAKITFDKANYQPGEKATILFTVLDAEGLAMPSGTVTAAFTAAPTVNTAFSGTAPTFLADVTIAAASSSTSLTTAGSQQYTAYMPQYAGDIIISATGGNGLAPAGRVAVTATASVSNNSADAATDAANEATDAANAATDAALAAADAADAATAAAEDASAAVATLAASVNTALDNLKAQITALTKLVNKLLKKK